MGGDITTQGLASLKRGGTLVLIGDQAGREARFEIARDFVSKNARIVAHQTALAPQEVVGAFYAVTGRGVYHSQDRGTDT